ncbi:transporter substrate-binding domain-containing protein [Vibrio sp. Isolate24]|uniref:substrate-binding periplasmic protein n=1 Tax=Vibrio sp. Isolate24 TaxID=2908534 RepID=UPI001EFDDBE9|nr:transporter substrate-binding domain-containing protein [Vibrio sp. Isolate24]MCG9677585.1 transporter substrate-binding domain-containing protein [Vibrio sp. Isolate24]
MSRILALVLLLILPPLAVSQTDDKVVKFVVGDWEPYTSSQNNPDHKIAEVLVRAAYQTQGYRVVIDYHPWSRAYRYAQSGQYDGTFPWFRSKQHEPFFVFSSPLFKQKIVFFYHEDSHFDWQKHDDLNQYRIGATQDYEVTRLLQSKDVRVEIANEDQSNFIKLGKHRIDAYPAAIDRGYYMMGTVLPAVQINKLRVHSKPIIEKEMYVMFAKHNHERNKKLNDVLYMGMRQLIQSGEYQKIISFENQVFHSDASDDAIYSE